MEQSQRLAGGIWGAIVGDALGVPVEFTSREERRHDPVTGMRGYGTHNQPSGTWSDDSSLLLCTVEALTGEYSPAHLAELFLAWKEQGYMTPHGSVFDIGIATRAAISRIKQGVAPEEAGGAGERDNGNGSLMRILPVALCYADAPVEEMLGIAHRVSSLTHRHPRSQLACGLYCLMAKALLEGKEPQDAYQYMIAQGQQHYAAAPFTSESRHFARLFSGSIAEVPEAEIASSGYVVHTLEASIWCLLRNSSYEETVLKAVNLGDDTDTTGCVAGGLAGVYWSIEGIPMEWLEAIETKEFFRDYIDPFVAWCGR
ncbi:MAG: ADP-ribosylglycohydrolase family protein [bacterium]